MKKNTYLFLLILISLVALSLRLWKLDSIPPSLNWDEAAFGYNAYSILKTARNEYGNFLPLAPIYVYLTVPSVALFGLTEFAVRFPAALFGALSVFLIYFVVQELFKEFEGKKFLGILTSVVLAVSPWSYHYSHSAWEINVFLVLLLLTFIFFLKAKKKIRNYLIVFLIFGFLALLVVNFISVAQEENGSPFNYYLREITERYLNHFSPRFLFFEGDWSNLMNHLDILLLPLGAFFLISRKIKNQSFLWYILLVAPLPAALSRDVIQATRSFFMIIPLTIISAFGVYFIWEKVAKTRKLLKIGIISVLIFGYLFSFVYYLDQFFVHAPIQNSQYWQYGYKEVVKFVKDKTGNYDKVVFTQKYGQPYIYWLFYTKYDPQKYQSQAKLIDNIQFRDIYWPKDRFIKKTLYVGGPYELPKEDIVEGQSRLLKEINFLSGETAFRIVETIK